MGYKILMGAILSCGLVACGGGSDDGASNKTGNVFYVTEESELPACAEGTMNQLWYVSAIETFKSCTSSGWSTVNVGTRIVSNKIIEPFDGDICESIEVEWCLFNGGQIIEFSDGTIILTASYDYSLISTDPSELNTDHYTVLEILPPSVQFTSPILHTVAPGSDGERYNLHLLWVRGEANLYLLLDSNENGNIDSTDEVIDELSTVEIGMMN